jgi:hypothetical protein
MWGRGVNSQSERDGGAGRRDKLGRDRGVGRRVRNGPERKKKRREGREGGRRWLFGPKRLKASFCLKEKGGRER